MKKSILKIMLAAALFCAGIAAAIQASYIYGKTGHTKGVIMTLGHSDNFTDAEIQAAADAVIKKFEADFKGCKLQSLTFDEQSSERAKSGYNIPDTIVLFSDFIAYPTSGTPDNIVMKNRNFSWMLRKDDNGVNGWELLTWGYG